MRTYIGALGPLLFSGHLAFAQSVPLPSPVDQVDLGQRILASEQVVLAKMVKRELVLTRAHAANRAAMTSDDYRQAGFLVTLAVDSRLCGAPTRPPKEVYVFLTPKDHVVMDDPDQPEVFLSGAKYLLFLKPDSDREDILRTYDLDSKRTYYRATGRLRGAIQLETDSYTDPTLAKETVKAMENLRASMPASQRALIDGKLADRTAKTASFLIAPTTLCQALQSENVYEKLNRLENLKSSADLVMRQNADYLVKHFTGPDGRPLQ